MMHENTNLLRWPKKECWKAFIYYGVLLNILWCVVYGGASHLTSLHSYRVRLHFDAELHVPFFPCAAIIYLSLFPMLWMSILLLQTPYKLRSFAKALAYLFLISGIGFLLFPADDVRTRQDVSGIIGQVYSFADWINLSHNYMPSLHVGMAVLCARLYSNEVPLKLSSVIWVWASAIVLSTLLIHEHYIIDLITGGALGYLLANTADWNRSSSNCSF